MRKISYVIPTFHRRSSCRASCRYRMCWKISVNSLRPHEPTSRILLKASLAPAEEFPVLVHETAHEMLNLDPASGCTCLLFAHIGKTPFAKASCGSIPLCNNSQDLRHSYVPLSKASTSKANFLWRNLIKRVLEWNVPPSLCVSPSMTMRTLLNIFASGSKSEKSSSLGSMLLSGMAFCLSWHADQVENFSSILCEVSGHKRTCIALLCFEKTWLKVARGSRAVSVGSTAGREWATTQARRSAVRWSGYLFWSRIMARRSLPKGSISTSRTCIRTYAFNTEPRPSLVFNSYCTIKIHICLLW